MIILENTQEYKDTKLTIPVGIGVVQTSAAKNFYNTSDADANSDDILKDKTAYGKYGKLTGTLDLDAEKEISYQDGYETGKVDGYDIGYDIGYQGGYTDGNNEGYQDGYAEGLDDGIIDGRNEIIDGQNDATITPQNVLRGYIGYGKNNERIVGASDAFTSIKLADYGMKLAYGTFSTVPEFIDFSGITNWNNMFQECRNITYLNLDLTGATSVSNMFQNACKSDADVTLNVDGLRSFNSIFYCCYLTSVNLLNAKPTSLYNAFAFAYIENIPEMDTSEMTSAQNAFAYSYGRIKHIPILDFSKVERTDSIFSGIGGTTNPIDITGFVNLGKGFTGNSSNFHKFDISLLYVPRQSCLNIFNNMYDMNLNGVTDATFVLRAADNANLTDDDIAIATAKGWTIQAR